MRMKAGYTNHSKGPRPMLSRIFLACGLALAVIAEARSQTIYPLHRADILTGAKFDFKVE